MIVAGDVFIYVGALERAFAQAGRVLRRGGGMGGGGVMAFSLERHEKAAGAGEGGMGFGLTRGTRFGHSLEYVRRVSRETGLEVVMEREVFLRGDVGKGWVVVVQRNAE